MGSGSLQLNQTLTFRFGQDLVYLLYQINDKQLNLSNMKRTLIYLGLGLLLASCSTLHYHCTANDRVTDYYSGRITPAWKLAH